MKSNDQIFISRLTEQNEFIRSQIKEFKEKMKQFVKIERKEQLKMSLSKDIQEKLLENTSKKIEIYHKEYESLKEKLDHIHQNKLINALELEIETKITTIKELSTLNSQLKRNSKYFKPHNLNDLDLTPDEKEYKSLLFMIDELADVSKKNQKLIFQYEMRIKELENLLEINREEIDNNPIENNKFQNDLKIKYDCLKHELKRTEFKWRIKLQRLRIKEEILLRQINLTKNEIETIYTKFKKIKDIENNQNSKEFNLTSLRQKSNTPVIFIKVMCFDYEKPVSSTFRINKSFAYYAHKGE